jgi:alkanesulfonate monooxygenase SsuD/methylene tetrahydromethanopterin reductase-like flavin-dependent oxidoreductase (luciferase family)
VTWTRLGLRFRPAAAGDDVRSFVGQLEVVARAAEDAGYDTLWLPAAVPAGVRAAGVLDPFVTAAALVPATSSIRLGCLEQPVEGRAPAMLAKAVASLDVLSGGRAALGFEVAGDTEALAEALRIVRSMLTEDAPTVEGSRFQVRGAWNEPRRRDGSPPIVVHLGTEAPTADLLEMVDGVVAAGAHTLGRVRRSVRPGLAVIARLDAASGGLLAAARDFLDGGCDAVVVDVAAGVGASERAARAADELASLLGS